MYFHNQVMCTTKIYFIMTYLYAFNSKINIQNSQVLNESINFMILTVKSLKFT